MLLIQHDAGVVLIDQQCPHDKASLAKGRVSGHCIRCPKHGIAFDLKQGQAMGGSAVEGVAPLSFYALVYREDMIGIEL